MTISALTTWTKRKYLTSSLEEEVMILGCLYTDCQIDSVLRQLMCVTVHRALDSIRHL